MDKCWEISHLLYGGDVHTMKFSCQEVDDLLEDDSQYAEYAVVYQKPLLENM